MVGRIDRLSELESSVGENNRIESDLREMIGYFNRISEVNTTGVEPLIQPFECGEMPLREDEAHETDGGGGLRMNAPRMRDGMVVTPRSI